MVFAEPLFCGERREYVAKPQTEVAHRHLSHVRGWRREATGCPCIWLSTETVTCGLCTVVGTAIPCADMRITFELESADIERFQGAFERSRQLVSSAEEVDIIDAAKQALDAICIDRLPGYVRNRLVHVQRLIVLLEDEEWNLSGSERSEVLAALVYFSDPDDLIPDHLEVIGLIDDAIMLEFIARRMRHVLAVYRQFCTFRNALGSTVRDDSERIARARTLAQQRLCLIEVLNARRERVDARIEQPA